MSCVYYEELSTWAFRLSHLKPEQIHIYYIQECDVNIHVFFREFNRQLDVNRNFVSQDDFLGNYVIFTVETHGRLFKSIPNAYVGHYLWFNFSFIVLLMCFVCM